MSLYSQHCILGLIVNISSTSQQLTFLSSHSPKWLYWALFILFCDVSDVCISTQRRGTSLFFIQWRPIQGRPYLLHSDVGRLNSLYSDVTSREVCIHHTVTSRVGHLYLLHKQGTSLFIIQGRLIGSSLRRCGVPFQTYRLTSVLYRP